MNISLISMVGRVAIVKTRLSVTGDTSIRDTVRSRYRYTSTARPEGSQCQQAQNVIRVPTDSTCSWSAGVDIDACATTRAEAGQAKD